MIAVNDKVMFRLFQMPCCGHLLRWINPRNPNYCPECGKFVLREMKTGDATLMKVEEAWLRYKRQG